MLELLEFSDIDSATMKIEYLAMHLCWYGRLVPLGNEILKEDCNWNLLEIHNVRKLTYQGTAVDRWLP